MRGCITLQLFNTCRCACVHSFWVKVNKISPPTGLPIGGNNDVDRLGSGGTSSTRRLLLKIVSVPSSKYLEQNVRISSDSQHSAIEPSGCALLRTNDLSFPKNL